MTSPGFSVEGHGTIVLIRPHTQAVREWLAENVDPAAQWFGDALVVEPRYVEPIMDGLFAQGFGDEPERSDA